MAAEIQNSWRADADKWGEWITAQKPLTDLETDVRDLKEFFNDRREFFNSHLDDLSRVYYNVSFVADGKEISSVKVRVGDSLFDLPEAPEKEGYTFLAGRMRTEKS